MRAERDPDLLLVERMLAPPPLEDARSSLEYWKRRRQALPLYRRAARREAKQMAIRWQERVRAAELALFEASLVGRLLAGLGLSSLWLRRVRFAKEALVWASWVVVMRKVKLVVGGLAALGLILVVATVAALVVVVAQLV
jgi:hypothetical protein